MYMSLLQSMKWTLITKCWLMYLLIFTISVSSWLQNEWWHYWGTYHEVYLLKDAKNASCKLKYFHIPANLYGISFELQNNNENYNYTCVYGLHRVSPNLRNKCSMYTYFPPFPFCGFFLLASFCYKVNKQNHYWVYNSPLQLLTKSNM